MVTTPNTRSTWNAIATGYDTFAPLDSGIIFHWNGPVMGLYSVGQVPDIIKATQWFHIDTRGWADIAYNFSIDRFGRLWEGRGDKLRNAASGDTFANTQLLACELLLGGFDSGAPGDSFTQEMKDGMVALGKQYVGEGRSAMFAVHRDVTATYCPGPEITQWVHSVLPGLVAGGGTPPPSKEDDDTMKIVTSDNKTIYCVGGSTKKPLVPAEKWPDTLWAIQQLLASGVASEWIEEYQRPDGSGLQKGVPQGALNRIPDA